MKKIRDFIRDRVQLRYEAIREREIERKRVKDICKEWKISKTSFYLWQERFRNGGIMEGLKDKKRGPRSPSKRTKETEGEIISKKFASPEKNIFEISDELKEKGMDVSPRTVARTLSSYLLTKKKSKIMEAIKRESLIKKKTIRS